MMLNMLATYLSACKSCSLVMLISEECVNVRTGICRRILSLKEINTAAIDADRAQVVELA